MANPRRRGFRRLSVTNTTEHINRKGAFDEKENLPSRTWRHLQRSTPSNESLDGFAAVVGVWWVLRRAEKGQRKMIEVCERVAQLDAASKRSEQSSTSEARFGETDGASSSTSFPSHRQAADGDGLFKDVVLYALTLVLQPVLAVVLTLAALWGLWKAFLWLIVL